jgi:hypothetical protein
VVRGRWRRHIEASLPARLPAPGRRGDGVELRRELREPFADRGLEAVELRVEPLLPLREALVAARDDALDLADAAEVLVVVGLDVGRREEPLGRRRRGR